MTCRRISRQRRTVASQSSVVAKGTHMTLTANTARFAIACVLMLAALLPGGQVAHSASALLSTQHSALGPVAQPKLAITARGGFGDDGSYLMGEWFPVHVTLANPPGGSTRHLRVEVE